MTEKFKFLKIFSFMAIIMALILIMSAAINPDKTTAGMNKADKVMLEFNNEKENTIDVIAVGDSEAYRSISPLEIYDTYGITCFVSASPSQTTYQAYNMLENALTRQKPQVCIIEANMLFTGFSPVSALAPKVENAFPIFKYHNIWKSSFNSEYTYEELIGKSFKGYRYSNVVKGTKNLKNLLQKDQTAKISSENTNYFEKMYNLCQENDIQVILISTPSAKNWNASRHTALDELAKSYNVPFIDLNTESSLGIDWTKDTYDQGEHLNYYGAHKVTTFVGEYINNNYDLPDHRNDKDYSSWDKALEKYLNKVS